MFLRAPAASETAHASIRSTRTWSSSSSSSAGRGASSLSGISNGSEQQEDSAGGSNEEPLPLVVGVAVGKEVKQCKANLMWVLSNLDALIAGDKQTKRKATVVLLHLHESEVSAFRQAEMQAMNRAMAKYRAICAKVKAHAVCKVETAVAGDGDVAQGILRLVAQNGIRRLVVGAAADKRYSSKMTAPSSRTAASVQQHAHPLCAIWFLCKGNLICTRPAAAESQAQHAPAAAATYTTRPGSLRRNDGEEPPPPPPPSVVHRLWVDNQQQERSRWSLRWRPRWLRHLEDKSRPAFIDLSYDDLLEATRNLDEALRLGQPGGYGAVYRAVVLRRGDKDKLEVAVKADATVVLMRCTVAYMDPEFLASRELRPSSDAYAFGVLLLRLLTGLPAMGLARQVQAALAEGRVTEILDASAGDWPYTLEQAEQLAHLAVRCCEMTSNNRPDLTGEMVDQTLECFQLQ
ncbi:U-box domain-containing protein 33-like [Panicum miliaceum]|uniref:RING-type E3 ubiquitin transferase n=1 Tax=Panicum miliaceum TaxID=4540 RepID=A0A3L6RYI5_PANMI|nr:U-box domain-containing protein 33-like [Panicum miliaceum]